MADDPRSKAVPKNLYYLAIDGTSAVDSVAYGELLENEFGWKNLVGSFLEPRADDPTLLADPRHPFLPICLYDARTLSKQVAVVCPAGRESLGRDSIWKHYAGEGPSEAPDAKVDWDDGIIKGTTVGRQTACERSTLFVSELICDPAIELMPRNGRLVPQLVDLDNPDRILPPESDVFRADLLLVSSHGWLGGFMRGNNCPEWPDAEPEEARKEVVPGHRYFLVGRAVEEKRGFFGPRWIILAQCSTVNRATWPLWTDLLSRSSPPVRGILAYEEVSPSAQASIPVAKSFVRNLKTKSILQSWIDANQGKKWAAIVHQEALHDRMADWRSFKDPTSVVTTATTASYRGFLKSIPAGEPILAVPPPFDVEIASTDPRKASDIQVPPPADAVWDAITPATLDRGRARLDQQWSRVVVTAKDGGKISTLKIRWIHIRETHATQPKPNQLFQQIRPAPPEEGVLDVRISGRDIVARRLDSPSSSMTVLQLGQPASQYPKIGLEQEHAYVWARLEVTLADGNRLHYDSTTNGMSF